MLFYKYKIWEETVSSPEINEPSIFMKQGKKGCQMFRVTVFCKKNQRNKRNSVFQEHQDRIVRGNRMVIWLSDFRCKSSLFHNIVQRLLVQIFSI